jgi:hypothetical protein
MLLASPRLVAHFCATVPLTCLRVSLTHQRVASLYLHVPSPAHGSTVDAIVLWFLLFFLCIPTFLLLFSLCCVSYHLQVFIWFDLLIETFVISVCSSSMDPVRILAILSLRQSFDNSCCLNSLELLTESFCSCLSLYTTFRKVQILFRIIVYCLFSFMYYLFRLDCVVGNSSYLVYPCPIVE